MKYPKASAYLKQISQEKKLTEVYELSLLERILSHGKTLEDYLALKKDLSMWSGSYPAGFSTLFKDWLDNEISNDDMLVYKGVYLPGQNIRYFRDFFNESKEDDSFNSKGNLTDFRAYGKSEKINREIIAFEGRFYDGLLSSYDDRTSSADDYISSSYMYNSDKEEENFDLLKLLKENDCLDAVHEGMLKSIVKEDLSKPNLNWLAENDCLHLLTNDAWDYAIYNDWHLDFLDRLMEKNRMDILSESIVDNMIQHHIGKTKECLAEVEKLVKEGSFYYENGGNEYLIPKYTLKKCEVSGKLKDINIVISENFDNLGTKINHNISCHALEDILAYLKTCIEENYLLSPQFKKKSMSSELISKLQNFCKKKHDRDLLNRMEPIRKIATERLALSKKEDKKKSTKKIIKYLIWIALIAGTVYWFKTKNKSDDSATLTDQIIADTASYNDHAGASSTDIKSPGKYYVSEKTPEGLTLYKDVKKKKKASYRLKCMEDIEIAKVEDSMGFFESFYDDNYNQIPRGWVEMKNLVPEKGFYTYEYGEFYRVKSDQEKLVIYKDYQKKGKLKTALSAMDQFRVYKIIGDIAYFKDFYKGATKYSGWVELDKIEKSN